MNKLGLLIALLALLVGCSSGPSYRRDYPIRENVRDIGKEERVDCGQAKISLVASHVSISLKANSNSTITHDVRYRVSAPWQCGALNISETKYLMAANRSVIERVERNISKSAGEHRSSFSFILSDGLLLSQGLRLLSDYSIGGNTKMRVEDLLDPNKRR